MPPWPAVTLRPLLPAVIGQHPSLLILLASQFVPVGRACGTRWWWPNRRWSAWVAGGLSVWWRSVTASSQRFSGDRNASRVIDAGLEAAGPETCGACDGRRVNGHMRVQTY